MAFNSNNTELNIIPTFAVKFKFHGTTSEVIRQFVPNFGDQQEFMNEEHELDPETQETLIFKDTWIKQILKEKLIK